MSDTADNDPLPLKRRHLVVLRDGRMAVLTHHVCAPAPFELLGHLTDEDEHGLWTINGRWTDRPNHTHRRDITHILDADGKPQPLRCFEVNRDPKSK